MADERSSPERPARWRDEAFEGEFLWARGPTPTLPSHHHPTWQIGLVRAGTLHFEGGSWGQNVSSKGLVVIAPRICHRIVGVSSEAEYAQVELPESLDLGPRWATPRISFDTGVLAFETLLADSYTEAPPQVRQASLQNLMTHIQTIDPTSGLPELEPALARVVQHLERTTDRLVPIAELTPLARMSRATLLRRFKQALGTTPHNYHLHVRLHAACENIDEGHSIGQASVSAGFADQAHLTRRARKILAMGPSRWTKRRRVGP